MRQYPSVLRCYVRPENGHYIAACLELNLCDRGEDLESAKAALEEDILGYIKSLTPEELPKLFPRPAPLYTYIDYYRVRLLILLNQLTHGLKERWAVFFEPLLLRPQLLHE
jgi:predicted RNase H-like HicB family nuclease